ncbi:MAG: thiamine-phosphate kinase [Betaproteobacteria bacterium]
MLSEFDIIERYFTPPTDHTVLAGGDDAALIAVTPGMELAISADALVSGRHFFDDAEPAGVGYKCMGVNLSDMAAMGARPRWVTLSLTLPLADANWLADFSRGFLEHAREHGVDLIGGDTTSGPLTVCVQIMGEVPPGQALRRSGAREGDDLWLSGTIGDAALALAHARGDFRLHADDLAYATKRLTHPQPRVELGIVLRGIATSAIDISDGLAADVGHIAKASGVQAIMQWALLPLSMAGARYRDHPLVHWAVLAGGDDYEIAFTAPPAARPQLVALAGDLGVALTRIGSMQAGQGVIVLSGRGEPLELAHKGFDHFRA